MLVITRKVGQTIAIGDDVEIEVLHVNADGQVRIGVIAPKSALVARGELLGGKQTG